MSWYDPRTWATRIRAAQQQPTRTSQRLAQRQAEWRRTHIEPYHPPPTQRRRTLQEVSRGRLTIPSIWGMVRKERVPVPSRERVKIPTERKITIERGISIAPGQMGLLAGAKAILPALREKIGVTKEYQTKQTQYKSQIARVEQLEKTHVRGETFVSPIYTSFQEKWQPYIKDKTFTGTEHQYGQFEHERKKAEATQEREYKTYQAETAKLERVGKELTETPKYWEEKKRAEIAEITPPLIKERAEKVMIKYKAKEAEWGARFKPYTSFVKGSIVYAERPEIKKETERTYAGYRRLFGLPSEPFEIERKAARIESEFKIGVTLEGMAVKPLKTVVTTAAFFALPPTLKGVGMVTKPAVVAGTKVFPKVAPWIAKWTPRAIAAGLEGTYAAGTGLHLYRTPVELRIREFGKITGTELLPMAVGAYAGIKVTPTIVREAQIFSKEFPRLLKTKRGAFPRKDPMAALRKKWASEQIGIKAKFRTGEWKPIETRSGILIQKMITKSTKRLKVGHKRVEKLQLRTTAKVKQRARKRAGKRKARRKVEHKYSTKAREAVEKERARMIGRQSDLIHKVDVGAKEIMTQALAKTQFTKEVQRLIQIGGTGLVLMPTLATSQAQKTQQAIFQLQKQISKQKEIQITIPKAVTVQVAKPLVVQAPVLVPITVEIQKPITKEKEEEKYLVELITTPKLRFEEKVTPKYKEPRVQKQVVKERIRKPKTPKIRITRKETLPLVLPFAWGDDKKKKKRKTKKKKQWEWLEEFTVQRPEELHFGAIESGIPKVSKVTMLPQITMADIIPKARKTKGLKGSKTKRSKKKKK